MIDFITENFKIRPIGNIRFCFRNYMNLLEYLLGSRSESSIIFENMILMKESEDAVFVGITNGLYEHHQEMFKFYGYKIYRTSAKSNLMYAKYYSRIITNTTKKSLPEYEQKLTYDQWIKEVSIIQNKTKLIKKISQL